MHKCDRRRVRIDNVDCATVGDVNTERDTALIADNAVAAQEFAAHRVAATALYHCYFITVNLFGGEQRPVAKSSCVANFAMGGIEPLKHFGLIMGNIDAGDSLREKVTADFDRIQRRKLFER